MRPTEEPSLVEKEPTVQVPVGLLLVFIRVYKERPQEDMVMVDYLDAIRLEQRAYRKYLEWKKKLGKETK
jgi:hypothetical protein